MSKKDWNKLSTFNAMHFYIPTSFWCVMQQQLGWSYSKWNKNKAWIVTLELQIKVK